MEFKFLIKKWANFYFFLQNLSEWHFTSRKGYNKFWRTKLGPFRENEEEALKKLKRLHLKYGFGKSKHPHLGNLFYFEYQPWQALEKHLSQKELTSLKEIFSIFQPKFELLWRKDSLLLKKWQLKLQEKLKNNSSTTQIANTLAILYKASPPKQIEIYLLFSSPNGLGGTAVGRKRKVKAITLEISKYPLKKHKIVLGFLWHEIIHACFEQEHFVPLLEQIIKERRLLNLVPEITANLLFPFGILGKKFLKIQGDTKIPKEYKKKFFSLMDNYISKTKPLDEKFIKKLASCSFKLESLY